MSAIILKAKIHLCLILNLTQHHMYFPAYDLQTMSIILFFIRIQQSKEYE